MCGKNDTGGTPPLLGTTDNRPPTTYNGQPTTDNRPPTTAPVAFALLEVLLAVAVFSMAATGFIVALHRTAELARSTQRELRITRVLESALDEALSLPNLEEGKTTAELEDDSGMEVDTLIEPIEDIENQDGQLLQNMWKITVTAFWLEGDQWEERSAETWRYGRLYQP
jgi:type II secretory pathway pseudopilin PulG